jgi:hypothetical protein
MSGILSSCSEVDEFSQTHVEIAYIYRGDLRKLPTYYEKSVCCVGFLESQ